MIPPTSVSRLVYARGLRVSLCMTSAVFAAVTVLAAATAAKRSFNIGGGDAATTLRQFAAQAAEQVVFPSALVRGVKTNPVKGEFTPREALDRMTRGTGLVVIQDEKSGALTVNRQVVPNGPRAQQAVETPPGSSGVAPQSGSDREVRPRGIIVGRVSNRATQSALEGALVEVVGTTQTALTDREGRYQLGVQNDQITLAVSFSGLDSQRVTLAVAGGATVVSDIALGAAIYEMEKFTVAGEREGQAKAEVLQRQAPNRKNVVSSDAFGNVADGNIAEMVQRIPGVAARYNDLEASTISIRGTDGDLNSVTVDGVQVAQSTAGRTRRSFEFDQQSLGNIETIEVIKAATPDMEGASIGGSVNLITKSAFDRVGGRLFTYSVGLAHQATTRFYASRFKEPIPGYGPALNFSYSDVFGEKKNLGVMLTGTLHSLQLTLFRSLMSYEAKPEPGPVFTQSVRISASSINRTRIAGGVKIDYRLSDKTTFSLGTSYHFTHKTDDNPAITLITGQALASVDASGNRTGGGTIHPVYTDGRTRVFPGNNSTSTISDATQDLSGETVVFQPRIKHRLEGLVIDYGATYSYSGSASDVRHEDDKYRSRPKGGVSMVLRNIGWEVDRSRNPTFPEIRQLDGSSLFDLNSYSGLQLNQNDRRTVSRIFNTKLDLRKEVRAAVPIYIKVGGSYNWFSRSLYGRSWRYDYTGPDGTLGTGDDNHDLTQFLDTTSPHLSDATSLKYFKWQGGTLPFVNTYGVARHAREHPELWKENVAFGTEQQLQSLRGITESVTAVYAMGNVTLGRASILSGVRLELTRDRGEGPLNHISPAERSRRAAWVGPITDEEARRRAEAQFGSRQTTEGRYQSVFPGIHLKYAISGGLLLRASWSTGIGRPDFGSIMPLDVINDEARTITRRNTDLKPQYANNYDLTLEYYFPSQGMFSIGVFSKRIADYIYTDTSQEIGGGADNGYDGQFEGYTVSTQSNRGSAKIEGLEVSFSRQLSFLPGWARGLGFVGNFTYLKTAGNYGAASPIDIVRANSVEGFTLPGYMPKTGNFGLSYRGYDFDVRLHAVHRGRFAVSGSVDPSMIQYRKATTTWSFQSRYAMSSRVSLFVDVDNIFAAPVENYRAYADRTSTYYTTAPKFVGGITGRF